MTNDPSPPTASDTKASTRILKYKRLSARIIDIQSVNATDKRPWHLLAAELAHHPNIFTGMGRITDSRPDAIADAMFPRNDALLNAQSQAKPPGGSVSDEIAPNNDNTERLADARARLAHLQVGVRT